MCVTTWQSRVALEALSCSSNGWGLCLWNSVAPGEPQNMKGRHSMILEAASQSAHESLRSM